MSNRRKIKPGTPNSNPVSDLLASMDGAQIPGGCDQCDAYQVIQAHTSGASNVHMIRVYHDDDCPVLAAHQGQRSNT